MNIIYLQSREPAAGIACPVRVQVSVTGSLHPVHTAACAADPLIDILDSGAGLRYRSEHHIIAFSAGTDRVCISAVGSCESMDRHTVIVGIINTCVLIIPRHRKSYVSEFNVLITCVLQCN